MDRSRLYRRFRTLLIANRGEIAGALERALKADCPVVIDVVTDIDAIAPAAVS